MRIAVLFALYYGAALYSLINPFYGLLFFVHILIFRPENLAWGVAAFGSLHMMTATLVAAGYVIHRHRYGLGSGFDASYQDRNLSVFVGFVLWLVVITALAESSIERSKFQTIEIAKILVICFLFAKMVRTANQLRLYTWVVSISLGLLSLWGVLQGLAGNFRLEELWSSGSNTLGALLVLMVPFTLVNCFDETIPSRARLLFFGCALAIILCCVYTGSRGAFLGLCVAMVTLAMQFEQRMKLLGAMALIGVLSLPFVPDYYEERIVTITAEDEKMDTSAEGRIVLWQIAFRIWQEYPIAGVGLDNFSPVKETFAGKVSDIVTSPEMEALIFNRERKPHGMYTCLLAETGLVGLSLFLWLFFRNALHRFPSLGTSSSESRSLILQAKGAQAGLIGFGVAALFGDFYYIEVLYIQMFVVGAVRGLLEKVPVSESKDRARRLGLGRATQHWSPPVGGAASQRSLSH